MLCGGANDPCGEGKVIFGKPDLSLSLQKLCAQLFIVRARWIINRVMPVQRPKHGFRAVPMTSQSIEVTLQRVDMIPCVIMALRLTIAGLEGFD